MRYWLVTPGWSTSCTAEAMMVDRASSSVNTPCARHTDTGERQTETERALKAT